MQILLLETKDPIVYHEYKQELKNFELTAPEKEQFIFKNDKIYYHVLPHSNFKDYESAITDVEWTLGRLSDIARTFVDYDYNQSKYTLQKRITSTHRPFTLFFMYQTHDFDKYDNTLDYFETDEIWLEFSMCKYDPVKDYNMIYREQEQFD